MAEPYIKRNPGDFITAQDWNEIQIKIRDFLNTHSHNGEEDQGIKLTKDKDEGDQNPSLKSKNIDKFDVGHLNVGTGNIASDEYKLNVKGNVLFAGPDCSLKIWGDGKDDNASLKLRESTDAKWGVDLKYIGKPDNKFYIEGLKNAKSKGKHLTIERDSGNIGIGTTDPKAKLDVNGGIFAGNSDIYFTNPDHDHSGIGNTKGYAAIENAKDFDALMILGRSGTKNNRCVKLWDYLQVNGKLEVTGGINIAANNEIFFGDNGQIRSLDNNHRILFRRSENKMELREWGDLLFSPGAKKGEETAKCIMKANGHIGISTIDPKVRLHVNGRVRGKSFESTNVMVHRMYPEDPLVYQNIFDAVKTKAIVKLGNARYDDKTHITKLWHDFELICFGSNDDKDDNGAEVNVPEGYNTVWVRVLGDRWNAIKAYFRDGEKEQLGIWTGGYRSGNCYCPDGSLADSHHDRHQWLPIPVGRSGKVALISKASTSKNMWFSGLAFSKNPWSHATQSAVGYHWAVNGGTKTKWGEKWENWKRDVLTKIEPKTNTELIVPFVSSGRDKLLYLVEHNNDWNGCMHRSITVNGKKIERFLSTYDNPFARHWNSKYFNRYIAARIPSKILPKTSGFLKVKIDMKKQNHGIHFREAGTHDLYV
ncbi:MAG: hypothetical protein GY714_15115 [Desulfobacterales bacterium]|nr:hypothetical protein [Desulfobacterales bacterium]